MVQRIGRRKFAIKLGSSVASITVSGTTLGALVGCSQHQTKQELKKLPADFQSKVEPVPGTRPELTPVKEHYKMYNISVPPAPDLDSWRLKIQGLVERPIEWTIDEIRKQEKTNRHVTLSCISNPVGGPLSSTTLWTGVSLKKILPQWHLKPQSSHLRITGADGFHECLALDTVVADERTMLVYQWDGAPLPIENGFPLRIYIPDRYGMKQPKWIETIEAIDAWEPGYSVKNTWDKEAIMKTTSVIDTVVEEVGKGQPTKILVGGIAHSGSRGISRVEIKVDENGWEPAILRSPLSELTWVIWRFEWPFEAGEHHFSVRAFDNQGRLQIMEASPPYPSGATGIHSKTESFKN